MQHDIGVIIAAINITFIFPCIYKTEQIPEGEFLEVINGEDTTCIEFVRSCPHIYKSSGKKRAQVHKTLLQYTFVSQDIDATLEAKK